MDNCIFCKIVNKDIPGKIIYEDEQCMAFLDLSQATYGHTLVIPKKHFSHILEVDDETLAHLMIVVKKLSKKIMDKCHAKGLNILTNTNEVAGQTVHHFHIHILPRYNSQELEINFNDNSEKTDLNEVYSLITK
ncbi:MAG: HIT family protein [Faecalibacillus sp.]